MLRCWHAAGDLAPWTSVRLARERANAGPTCPTAAARRPERDENRRRRGGRGGGDHRAAGRAPGSTWSQSWTVAVRRAELPAGTGFHALRHYYASLLTRHGESVKVVQDRLGHATAAETLDTYSHLWPDSEDRTREAVDAVLGAISCAPGVPHDGDSLTSKQVRGGLVTGFSGS